VKAGAVAAHLDLRLPGFTPAGPPVPLSGGILNVVWRVPGSPRGVIVKHAPPHVAAKPEIPLDPGRLAFEARALEALGPRGRLAEVASGVVRAPRLLDFDAERSVLVMEDLGPLPHLGDWLGRTTRPGAPAERGETLGRFVASLHAASRGDAELAAAFDNRAVQRTRDEVQYRAIERLLREAGRADAPELGRRAVELGASFQEPGRCLIMGDLWPPSVLVAGDGLRVIDWELAHYGNPAQDVGHLAAHLWMHAHRAADPAGAERARLALDAFLRGYVAALGSRRDAVLAHGVLEASAVHFGAEVLVRTAGGFRGGYLYDAPGAERAIAEAVAVAVRHIGSPGAVETFAALSAARG
jgi:Phosphotransferase enzyme family